MRASRWLIAVACGLCAVTASAQFFRMGGMRQEPMPEIKGSVRIDPGDVVVGVPCQLVFSFGAQSSVEIQQIQGLPETGIEYMARELEPYADHTYRLPVRFLEPQTNMVLNLVVAGMQTVKRGAGTSFVSSYSTSFQQRLPPLRFQVRPLPETGRPANFSGAVGTRFLMTQKLEPDHVHPGDLVTATYELKFEGYCPSNVWPQVERLSKEFKAYEPKEVARSSNSFKWTQVLVPRTVAATNSALVSLSYYNPRTQRFEWARAYPKKLVFVSNEAASTKNTTVVINEQEHPAATTDGGASKPSDSANAPLVLRFGPSEASPVIVTLPPGTPAKELSRSNGWRRLETPRAIGWTR